MKKCFFLFLAALFFVFGCSDDNKGNPVAASGDAFLGTWVYQDQAGLTTTTFKIKADSTFERSMTMVGAVFSKEIGKWTVSNQKILLSKTNCQEVPGTSDDITLVTIACDPANEEIPIQISGNKWTIPSDVGNLVFTKK